MQPKLLITILLFSMVLFSCGKSSDQRTEQDSMMSEPAPEFTTSDVEQQLPPQQIPVQKYQQDSVIKPAPLTPSANIDWDKKIIKTATVKLEVSDFKAFNEVAHKTVRQFGGYVAQEDNNMSDEKQETIMSIKVPVNKFEDVMNGLSNAGSKLLERKITSEDVTGELIDTKSRLEAKKEMRLKYLEFLRQSKNMKEVLEVQSEINNIQEEIEAATGRIGFLSHQAAYSTIHLTFFQPLVGYIPDNKTPSFFTRISQAFKGGAEWVKNIFVALIYIWPLLLALIFGIFLIRRQRPARMVSR